MVLIALFFPIVGIGMIIFALNTTLAWRKFGQSMFDMAAVPAALGGTLGVGLAALGVWLVRATSW